ncbi:MAG TPA: phage tail sheath C-terminal domain-containing protein, partial [Longimicrobiaceae bacterium]
AFVGRTQLGPVNEPISISSYGEFQRMFGGLYRGSSVSYAVRDFFQNGGAQAVVVRLTRGTYADDAPDTSHAAPAALSLTVPPDLSKALASARTVSDAALKGSRPAADAAADAPKPTAADVARAASTAAATAKATSGATQAEKDAAQGVSDATGAASFTNPAPTAAAAAAASAGAVGASVGKALAKAFGLRSGTVPEVDAAQSVVVAAITAAAADGATPAAVATAARKQAETFTSGSSQHTAADAVATAAETESTRTGDPAATAVSVVDAADAEVPAAVTAALATGSPALPLTAAYPGAWGNGLQAQVDRDGITDAFAASLNPTWTSADVFNLNVVYVSPDGQVTSERYINVSTRANAGARHLQGILAHQSNLVRTSASPSTDTPAPATGAAGSGVGGADGGTLDDRDYLGNEDAKTGMYALNKFDLFNLLCIPPDVRNSDTAKEVYQAAAELCVHRRAMLVLDPPMAWADLWTQGKVDELDLVTAFGLQDDDARNSVVYFPRIREADPQHGGQLDVFPPSGAMAGIMARTDTQRGVWKAPAGLNAGINGIDSLQVKMSDSDNGKINPLGINALRSFPVIGNVVWGARTIRGADQLADDYKYVPVRRLVLYIEESLYRGTQWAVFEPNDEPLWSQLRLNVGAFMSDLFRQGAFQGGSPKDAYFVRCDASTTTQNDINQGKVNIIVGFAPLKPAEFVIISIQQIAGQIQT